MGPVDRLTRVFPGAFVETNGLVEERVHGCLDRSSACRAGHRRAGGVRVIRMADRHGRAVDADSQVGADHVVVDGVSVLVDLEVWVVGRHPVRGEAHRVCSFRPSGRW